VQARTLTESGTHGVQVQAQCLRFEPWGCAFLRPANGH
jgi:hypothetical protein